MSLSSFRFPTDIRFGAGAITLLPRILRERNVKRPLLVTDHGVLSCAFFTRIQQLLAKEEVVYATYSDFGGNPTKKFVTAGVEAFRRHNADGLIILGGGCALDVGKAIGLMATHEGDLFDYEDDKPGAPAIEPRLPFMVAIPTTAGTGSEVGGSSVISDDETHRKVIIWGTAMVPKVVLADPELTFELPATITAYTGMDALTHNIEAYLAKNYHPMCEGIAVEGVRLAFEFLPRAVENPHDLEARKGMLMSSMMGATAFQKGLGVTHSCAHALSTCFDWHHGFANAVMLSACLRFNRDVSLTKLAHLGRVLGGTSSSIETLADFFLQKVETLCQEVGIPTTLKAKGAHITEALIEVATHDSCHLNNPKPCTKEDFRRIFQSVEG